MTEVNTYWLSRKPKLTAEEVFVMGRQHLLNGDYIDAVRILKSAAKMGHPEAIWLNDRFTEKNVMAGKPFGFDSTWHWLESLFTDSDDPIAVKYRLWFSLFDEMGDMSEIFALASAGEMLAQFKLGQYCLEFGDDAERSEMWYRKAADQGFVEADCQLAGDKITYHEGGILEESMKYVLPLFDAANRGCHSAMKFVHTLWSEKGARRSLISTGISELDVAIILARCDLETDRCVHESFCNQASIRSDCNDQKIYLAGKTFDGVLEFYPVTDHHTYKTFIIQIVNVYQQMTSNARQATIHTLLVLQTLGVCRDIRTLIAKLLYATRMDVEWRYPID